MRLGLMGKGLVYQAEGPVVFCRPWKVLEQGRGRTRGGVRGGELEAQVGPSAPVPALSTCPLLHAPLSHGAVLQGVTSPEFPLCQTQSFSKNCSSTPAVGWRAPEDSGY